MKNTSSWSQSVTEYIYVDVIPCSLKQLIAFRQQSNLIEVQTIPKIFHYIYMNIYIYIYISVSVSCYVFVNTVTPLVLYTAMLSSCAYAIDAWSQHACLVSAPCPVDIVNSHHTNAWEHCSLLVSLTICPTEILFISHFYSGNGCV